MKKVLIVLMAMVSAVACLGDYVHTESGQVCAEFEYLNMDYDKVFGADSLFYDVEQSQLGISWGQMLYFYHKIENNEFQGGFLLSYLGKPQSGTEGLSNNEYRVNCPAPKTGVNTYVVFYENPDKSKMPEKHMSFLLTEYGACVMQKCLVNNTVSVAQAVAKNFEQGDKMLLRATGYLKGVKTNTAEITLAEYTSAKDSIVSSWTTFDLSALGSIDQINFDIIKPEGKEIPSTVCMDNVIANVNLSY